MADATILHGKTAWPVTDAWHERNTAPWPEFAAMSREACDAERWRILRLSDERRLTSDERARLTAVTNHYNARNALKVLGEPDLSAFGFEGVDQLHGVHSRFPCGCDLMLVFDHHANAAKAAAIDLANATKDASAAKGVSQSVKGRSAAASALLDEAAALAGVDPKVAADIEVVAYPHTPTYVCDDHAHLVDDLSLLHATVEADAAADSEALNG